MSSCLGLATYRTVLLSGETRTGISVDLEDSTLIGPTIDRARRKTAIELIVRLLRMKFLDGVPADLPQQLEKLPIEELREAFDSGTTATSMNQVLVVVAALGCRSESMSS